MVAVTITDDAAAFLKRLKGGTTNLADDLQELSDLLSRTFVSAVIESERPEAELHRKGMVYWVTRPLEDLSEAAQLLADAAKERRGAVRNERDRSN